MPSVEEEASCVILLRKHNPVIVDLWPVNSLSIVGSDLHSDGRWLDTSMSLSCLVFDRIQV